MKRFIAALLALVLALSLCACSKDEYGTYRVVEVIGTKQYGTVCRAGDKAAQAVDAAMKVLAANGTLSALSVQWLGRDVISLEGDPEALNKLEEEIAPRTFIVGVEADLKPLSYTEGDSTQGLNVDIAQALGQLLGWDIVILPISDGAIGTHLSAGNIDCALGFGIETLSASDYALGPCYMESDIAVAVPAGSEIGKLKDLKGLRIGTVGDPSVTAALAANDKVVKYADGATTYLSTTRCMTALEKGWCAAVAMDALCLGAYFG
ncbi:MAG: transporter substrate-binding domain-containing protein [Oscillospiraceae bacterium]